jgi:hypothetical protein
MRCTLVLITDTMHPDHFDQMSVRHSAELAFESRCYKVINSPASILLGDSGVAVPHSRRGPP